MKKIYVGTPYSHPLESVRYKRHAAVTDISVWIIEQGFLPFSPITECHLYVTGKHAPDPGSPDKFGWEFWAERDLALLEMCDEMWIAAFEGWDKSVGLEQEIIKMRLMGKPVKIICTRPGCDSLGYHDAEKGMICVHK
jgi:hypothetical protein